MSHIDTLKVTVDITGSTTVSSVANADGGMLLRVSVPDITSTAFTIQTGVDVGGTMTYQTEYIAGADKSYTVADNKNVNIAADQIICNEFRLVMGSEEAADCDIYVQVLRL